MKKKKKNLVTRYGLPDLNTKILSLLGFQWENLVPENNLFSCKWFKIYR